MDQKQEINFVWAYSKNTLKGVGLVECWTNKRGWGSEARRFYCKKGGGAVKLVVDFNTIEILTIAGRSYLSCV